MTGLDLSVLEDSGVNLHVRYPWLESLNVPVRNKERSATFPVS